MIHLLEKCAFTAVFFTKIEMAFIQLQQLYIKIGGFGIDVNLCKIRELDCAPHENYESKTNGGLMPMPVPKGYNYDLGIFEYMKI